MREEEIGLRYALRVFLEDGEKKSPLYFQKCPKGPKSPRSYFFDISLPFPTYVCGQVVHYRYEKSGGFI